MKKFLEIDGGNPDGTAKDRDGLNPGTTYFAKYWNDNMFNLFEFIQTQGYTLIDADSDSAGLEQIAKACKAKYNPNYTYNTSTIVTQSVNDIVEGSDGAFYEVQNDGVTGDDPVGSVTGNWVKVPFDKGYSDTKLFSIAGGTANALTVTIPAITEYAVNSTFRAKATLDNTGATTINLNGLGVKNVVIDNTALSGGEIVAGNEYFFTYSSNGNFELTALGSDIEVATDTEIRTGTNNTKAITPLGYNQTTLGWGQTWQNVTASRSAGVTYTNTTGKPIEMIVLVARSSNIIPSFTIDGIDLLSGYNDANSQVAMFSFIVQDGKTYNFSLSAGSTIFRWLELRQ